jgi:hypothetical protein
MNNFSLVISKISDSKGLFKPGEIIKLLGLNQRTFYTWKRRGKIPMKEIPKIAERAGIPLPFLLQGTPIAEEETGLIKIPGGKEMRIKSLLETADKILRSHSPFASALAYNIDTLWFASGLLDKRKNRHPTIPSEEVKT